MRMSVIFFLGKPTINSFSKAVRKQFHSSYTKYISMYLIKVVKRLSSKGRKKETIEDTREWMTSQVLARVKYF